MQRAQRPRDRGWLRYRRSGFVRTCVADGRSFLHERVAHVAVLAVVLTQHVRREVWHVGNNHRMAESREQPCSRQVPQDAMPQTQELKWRERHVSFANTSHARQHCAMLPGIITASKPSLCDRVHSAVRRAADRHVYPSQPVRCNTHRQHASVFELYRLVAVRCVDVRGLVQVHLSTLCPDTRGNTGRDDHSTADVRATDRRRRHKILLDRAKGGQERVVTEVQAGHVGPPRTRNRPAVVGMDVVSGTAIEHAAAMHDLALRGVDGAPPWTHRSNTRSVASAAQRSKACCSDQGACEHRKAAHADGTKG